MPVIFEYAPRNTFIHRLQPITKIIYVVCMFTIISLIWDPRFLAICAAVALSLYLLSRTPKKWLLLSAFALYRFIEAGIVGLAQPAGVFKHLPPEIVKTLIFQLGPIKFYYGGLIWAFAYVFRIFIGMAITFMFIYTTSINDIIKTLKALHFPPKILFVIVLAFRFVPELVRELGQVSMAQKLRGWKIKTRNPIKAAKMAIPVAGPITRRLVSYVDRLHLTVQIRAFSGERLGYAEKIKLGKADIAVIVVLLFLTAATVYSVVAFGFAQL